MDFNFINEKEAERIRNLSKKERVQQVSVLFKDWLAEKQKIDFAWAHAEFESNAEVENLSKREKELAKKGGNLFFILTCEVNALSTLQRTSFCLNTIEKMIQSHLDYLEKTG